VTSAADVISFTILAAQTGDAAPDWLTGIALGRAAWRVAKPAPRNRAGVLISVVDTTKPLYDSTEV